MVPALFEDRHASVRAQAAVWAVDHSNPSVLMALLSLLNDANALCRFMAQNALVRLGSDVVPPLVAVLSSHTARQVEAALAVAIELSDARCLPPALTLCHDVSPRIRALAATLLCTLG